MSKFSYVQNTVHKGKISFIFTDSHIIHSQSRQIESHDFFIVPIVKCQPLTIYIKKIKIYTFIPEVIERGGFPRPFHVLFLNKSTDALTSPLSSQTPHRQRSVVKFQLLIFKKLKYDN